MDLAVNVALPSITAAFSLDTRAIRWVGVCYVLTYSCLMLAFGRLGDHIGHRRVFRAGLWVGTAAFVLCATAPDYRWLLAARIAQGIATALLLSCAPALTTFLFAQSERTRALGAYSSLGAAASIAAPLIGGAGIGLLGWSGAFWFRVPVAVLALALLPLLPEAKGATREGPGHPLDLFGAVLLACAIAMALLSVALLGSDAESWLAAPPALAGVAALIVFTRHQRLAADPVLPRSVARARPFVRSNAASIALHFVAFGVPLLVPYYLARIGGHSAFYSGAILVSSPLGMLLGSILAVRLTAWLDTQRTAVSGGLLVAGSSLAISLWPSMAAPAIVPATLLLHGAGVGLFQVAYADFIVAALPAQARGVAGSLTMVTRTIGVATAATALTAALQLLELRELANGETGRSAFAAAFSAVFLYAGALLGTLFLLGIRSSNRT
jgi:predicted MFS family arabinose efflux permease